MKNFFYILVLALFLASCSDFQKALKSVDVATKFKTGNEYYEAGKWNKANRLFAQIVPNYRGKPQAEKLMYLYSDTFYQMGDFYQSGYQFGRFEGAYPNSEKVEDAAFYSAKSLYNLSPVYSKEQTETIDAIEKLQIFINKYPESIFLTEANKLVKELDYKLEKKAFEIAKQYNTISDYQASIKSFDNFMLDYPGTTLKEQALFYKFDSAYKLAMNSVASKEEVRLTAANTYFNTLKRAYSNSEFISDAEKMNEEIKLKLEQFKTKS
jgi:outer membrane protein assembly factor BamD